MTFVDPEGLYVDFYGDLTSNAAAGANEWTQYMPAHPNAIRDSARPSDR